MLGDVLAAIIEFVGDIIFALLPDRIGWHILGALGLGAAAGIAASFWPDRIAPAAAAAVGTLVVYPSVLTIYSLACRDSRRDDLARNKKRSNSKSP